MLSAGDRVGVFARIAGGPMHDGLRGTIVRAWLGRTGRLGYSVLLDELLEDGSAIVDVFVEDVLAERALPRVRKRRSEKQERRQTPRR